MTLLKSSGRPKRPKLFLVRRVRGQSMLPALAPGTLIVALRPRRLRVGDVVVVRHDGQEKIKRIAKLDEQRVFLLGDNEQLSTDSRDFGWVPLGNVIGRAHRLFF